MQRAILSQPLPALLPHHPKRADAGPTLRRDPASWTKAWQQGAISNFECAAVPPPFSARRLQPTLAAAPRRAAHAPRPRPTVRRYLMRLNRYLPLPTVTYRYLPLPTVRRYLMRLNTLAGRTYSDLTQYPVMPWVLSDYSSPSIDLRDPSVYRDLSRPMGALNAANHARLKEQYDALRDTFDEVGDPRAAPPPFHFGSHYSSVGSVLFFLLRVEPFTTQALALQGGRFDHADRLFHSLRETYEHIVEAGNTSDVKELVPEMFYLPELLRNRNGFGLGVRQVTVGNGR